MDSKHTVPSLAAQFAVACNLTTLYLLMTLREGLVGRMFPLSLLAYAPLLYLLNALFLRRERTLRGLLVLNVCAMAVYAAVCIYVDGLPEISQLAFMLLFTAWLTIKGQSLARKPPQVSGVLLCLDGSILTLMLFSAYTAAVDLDLVWSIPVLSGFSAAVLGTAVRRMDRSLGWRETGVLAAACGVIILFMWLLLSLVAAPTGHGLVLAWQGLGLLITLAQRVLTWLIECLVALFQSESLPAVFLQEEYRFDLEDMTAGEEKPVIAAVMGGVLLVLAIAGVIWLLRYLGTIKLKGKKLEKAVTARRTRPSLARALRELLADWRKKLALRRFLRRNRNTPIGLYFHLVQRCRVSPWHKRPGETPREFLVRLEGLARNDEALLRAMKRLVPAVDESLYGAAPVQKLEGAQLIRRRIGAVVRRQAVRDKLDRLRSGCGRWFGAEGSKTHEAA